ncbi:hypothetical protein [Glycocaulis sp.]
MKKFLVSAAAVAVFGASSAFAQAVPVFGDDLTVTLSAEVGEVCGARLNAGDGLNLDVDFGELTNTPAADQVAVGGGSITYVCNVLAGFTREFSSDNDGYLVLDGVSTTNAQRRIAWTVAGSGAQGNQGLAETQLTSPVVQSRGNGGGLWRNGQTSGLTFRADGVAVPSAASSGITTTTVFAGDYSDVMRISIRAN